MAQKSSKAAKSSDTSVGGSPEHPADEGTLHAAKTSRRFVVSHLVSPHITPQKRTESLERFCESFERVLRSSVNVVSDRPFVAAATNLPGVESKAAVERRVLLCEADPGELLAKSGQMTSETVIEPELPRVPAIAYPADLVPSAAPTQQGPGTGSTLILLLKAPSGDPVTGATVIVRFNALGNPSQSIVAGGRSDASGSVSVAFDSNTWRPALAAVEPAGKYWTAVAYNPQSGQTIQMQELPRTGPFGWWQLVSGAAAYSLDAGRNIKVGVIDSGVGPHPYLTHAIPIGAFTDGGFLPGVDEGRDVQSHGTHVSGIIGARPPEDSGAFGGIAPGAGLYVARIFTATGGGNQGDVANAIDALSGQYEADIINMSLTGAPSAIEHDAIIAAFQRGTVCVCAAGNQTGAPVGYPAAYPECVAVSALGLINTAPTGTMPALNVPASTDRFGIGGLFLASFSNLGPKVYCAGPGNGIVSTVPANSGDAAPYADMSGTSMASPIVAGVLAGILSRNEAYMRLERTVQRAVAAKSLLGQHAMSIGLNSLYQGFGLARTL